MPKQISLKELDAIVAAIGAYPDGLLIGELRAALPFRMELRKLQRRLAGLKLDGKVVSRGAGRATRYVAVSATGRAVVETERIDFGGGQALELSPEGLAIRRQVRRPQAERTPVGYRGEFLESYRPNKAASGCVSEPCWERWWERWFGDAWTRARRRSGLRGGPVRTFPRRIGHDSSNWRKRN